MNTVLASLPGWLRFLVWLLIVVVVIIVLALIIHALHGFDWTVRLGYFHWTFGVS